MRSAVTQWPTMPRRVRMLVATGLAGAACFAVSEALFGSWPALPLQGLLLVAGLFLAPTAILWHLAFLLASAIGGWLIWRAVHRQRAVPNIQKPAIVLAGAMVFGWTLVAVVATASRHVAIIDLDPEHIETRTFLYSMHRRGKSALPQAAAVKDCAPYLWSWRRMAFVDVSQDRRARRMIPDDWLEGCGPAATERG